MTMKSLVENRSEWILEYGRKSVIESTNFMLKNRIGCSVAKLLRESRVNGALFKAVEFNAYNAVRPGIDWELWT